MSRRRRPAAHRLLEPGQGAARLFLLGLAPGRPLALGGPQHGFVAHQQGGVQDAVGQGLVDQGGPLGLARRDQPAPAQIVQVFAHDPAVVQRPAVVRDQRRQLAQGVVPHQFGVVRRGQGDDRGQFDPVGQAQLMGGDQAFAHVGRGRRVVQFHASLRRSEFQAGSRRARRLRFHARSMTRVQSSAASARPAIQPNVSAGPRVMPGPG